MSSGYHSGLAYTGASDDEVIEATLMDRRWHLVLDCLDTEQAPISLGTLVAFRQRLIEAQMDRRLNKYEALPFSREENARDSGEKRQEDHPLAFQAH